MLKDTISSLKKGILLIKVIYDLFEVLRPQVAPEQKCSSKRKRQPSLTLDIDPKRKKIRLLKKGKISKDEDAVE